MPKTGRPPLNRSRVLALKRDHYATRVPPAECGECGRPVGPAAMVPHYRRDPITGRRSSSVWCDDCYERAHMAGVRDRAREFEAAVRKVA